MLFEWTQQRKTPTPQIHQNKNLNPALGIKNKEVWKDMWTVTRG